MLKSITCFLFKNLLSSLRKSVKIITQWKKIYNILHPRSVNTDSIHLYLWMIQNVWRQPTSHNERDTLRYEWQHITFTSKVVAGKHVIKPTHLNLTYFLIIFIYLIIIIIFFNSNFFLTIFINIYINYKNGAKSE